MTEPNDTPNLVTEAICGPRHVDVCNRRIYRPSMLHNVVFKFLARKVPEDYERSMIEMVLMIQVYSTKKEELSKFKDEWTIDKLLSFAETLDAVEDTHKIMDAIEAITNTSKRLQQVMAGGGDKDPTQATVD